MAARKEGVLSSEDSQNEARAGEEQRPTRERILDAAEKLFAANGFDATTTQRISRESGTPSGLVFYYFGTKQGLLKILLEERTYLPELRDVLRSAADGDPRSALTNTGVGFMRALEREKNLVRILLGESLTNEAVSERFTELREEAMALISAYLDEAVQEGRLNPVDSRSLTRSFMYTMLFAAVFEDVKDPQAFAQTTANLLLENRIPDD